MNTKTALVQKLASEIPSTVEGLPQYLLRVDLLPAVDGDSEFVMTREDLETCKLVLNYDQGYPCFTDGRPVWSRLYHESQEAYRAFENYMEQGPKHGIRQLQTTEDELKIPLSDLAVWFTECFWLARAKAYDVFRVQAHQAQRVQRLMTAEDRQFLIAENLFTKAEALMEDENFLDALAANPRNLLEALKVAGKLQSQAVGMAGNGKKGDVNVHINTAAASENRQRATNATLDRVLSDPRAAELMQELVLRMELDNQGNTKLQVGVRTSQVPALENAR